MQQGSPGLLANTMPQLHTKLKGATGARNAAHQLSPIHSEAVPWCTKTMGTILGLHWGGLGTKLGSTDASLHSRFHPSFSMRSQCHIGTPLGRTGVRGGRDGVQASILAAAAATVWALCSQDVAQQRLPSQMRSRAGIQPRPFLHSTHPPWLTHRDLIGARIRCGTGKCPLYTKKAFSSIFLNCSTSRPGDWWPIVIQSELATCVMVEGNGGKCPPPLWFDSAMRTIS